MSVFKIHLTIKQQFARDERVTHLVGVRGSPSQLIVSVSAHAESHLYIYALCIFIHTYKRFGSRRSYVIRRAKAAKKNWHRLHFRVWRNPQRAPEDVLLAARGTFLLFRPLIISLFNGFAAGRGQHGAFDLRYFCKPDNIAPPAHAHLSDITKNAEAAGWLLERARGYAKNTFLDGVTERERSSRLRWDVNEWRRWAEIGVCCPRNRLSLLLAISSGDRFKISFHVIELKNTLDILLTYRKL